MTSPESVATQMIPSTVDPTPGGDGAGDRGALVLEAIGSEAVVYLANYRDENGNMWSVPRECYFAFRYCFCRDHGVRSDLKAALLIKAVDLKHRERWSGKVLRFKLEGGGLSYQKYLEDMCETVLAEAENPDKAREAGWHARRMRTSPRVWRVDLAKRYEAVRIHMDIWAGIACGHIKRNYDMETAHKTVA